MDKPVTLTTDERRTVAAALLLLARSTEESAREHGYQWSTSSKAAARAAHALRVERLIAQAAALRALALRVEGPSNFQANAKTEFFNPTP